MTPATPRLTRSIPFAGLIVVSIAAIAAGAWIALSQIDAMTVALTAGTATGVEVYAGQSWAVVGAVVLGAGVVGLLLSLAIGAVRSLLPVAAPVDDVSSTVWADDDFDDEAEADAVVDVVPASEIAVEPVAADAAARPAGDTADESNGRPADTDTLAERVR